MQTEKVKKQLLSLVAEINSNLGNEKLKYHEQDIVKEHMSLSGGNGRIWIEPAAIGYDVSLSGNSIEKALYPVFKDIFGKSHFGYKQSGKQPYWRTDSFTLLKSAVLAYSQTEK